MPTTIRDTQHPAVPPDRALATTTRELRVKRHCNLWALQPLEHHAGLQRARKGDIVLP